MTLWLIRAGSRGEHEQKFKDGDSFDRNLPRFAVVLSSINLQKLIPWGAERGNRTPLPPWPSQQIVQLISSLVCTCHQGSAGVGGQISRVCRLGPYA